MRVTFVLPGLDLTGGNRVVSVYARMLRDAGHAVVVVAAGARQRSLKQRFVGLIRGASAAPGLAVPRSHLDGLGLDVRRLDVYRRATDDDVPDADVVIATWWETAEWVAELSATKGTKIYLVQHHEVFPGLPIDRVRATYRLPMKKLVVADWLRDVMLTEYGDPEVEVVSNAVDAAQFFAPPRTRQPRPTMGFMSSTTEFKGPDVAAGAIREVKHCIPELKVICFGHELINGLEFMDSDLEFHRTPNQDKIREVYSQVDVWLSSSRSEGFNLPALEAMACRTPVVSTRTGWPATAVIPGRNGFLADVGDAHGLANGVRSVLASDLSSWQAMSEAAFDTARPLTWNAVFPAFEAALTRACLPPETRAAG